MGRRGRARTRQAGTVASAAGRPDRSGRPDPSHRPDRSRGRQVARALNPRRTPTRRRMRIAAIAFLAGALVLLVLGRALHRPELDASVLPLAILGALWLLFAKLSR